MEVFLFVLFACGRVRQSSSFLSSSYNSTTAVAVQLRHTLYVAGWQHYTQVWYIFQLSTTTASTGQTKHKNENKNRKIEILNVVSRIILRTKCNCFTPDLVQSQQQHSTAQPQPQHVTIAHVRCLSKRSSYVPAFSSALRCGCVGS